MKRQKKISLKKAYYYIFTGMIVIPLVQFLDGEWEFAYSVNAKRRTLRKATVAPGRPLGKSSRLKVAAEEGKTFAFSCLPYTAQELENAMHHEELPVPRRTVLSIFGAVRGVGGIDSWGADVEAAYHISAEENISYGFYIE